MFAIRSTRRIWLICFVALALAPGTFVRSTFDVDANRAELTIIPLQEREGISSEFEVTGAWELSSSHPMFGGFSSLVDGGEDGLLMPSDRGWLLRLPLIDGEPQSSPKGAAPKFINYTATGPIGPGLDPLIDLEAMTRDRKSGILWTAFEGRNVIQRDDNISLTGRPQKVNRAPEEMRDWSANSGAETLEILPDGRFLVLAESPDIDGRRDRPGLLFAGDPITHSDPIEFRISTPRKFSPVDATALPDGTVLVLLRRVQVSIPATFDAAIMRADPAQITAGGMWQGEIVARFTGPLFGENFEGIAFVPDGSGESGDIYLVSDDNISIFQRSLLVRLAWKPQTDNSAN